MSELSESDKRLLREMAAWYRQNKVSTTQPEKRRQAQILGGQKLKIGKADSDITAGSTGTVSIWRDGVDTGENITDVQLDWMHGSEDISSGKEVLIAYFDDEFIWRIIGADCE